MEIELNGEGVRQLLQSEEVASFLKQKGKAIQSRCGNGYEMDSHVGKTRVNVQVKAVTHKARRDNLKNNTLLKAVHQ